MFDRVAVLGVGAIGGIIGGYLTRAGRDVTLIDQWGENVEAVREKGLTVSTQEGDFTVQANAVHLGEVCNITDPFDLVFLAVKSYDTRWATHFILSHLSPDGVIVSAQNGINDEQIGPIAGWSRVLGCVITLGAGMYEPANPIRTSAASRLAFTVGEPSGVESNRAHAVADMLSVIGPTKVTSNLWGQRWAKLATNSMANPICALTGTGVRGIERDSRSGGRDDQHRRRGCESRNSPGSGGGARKRHARTAVHRRDRGRDRARRP